MKKFIIITSIIVILIGGYFIYKAISDKNTSYTLIPVSKGEVVQTVSVTGTVIPAKQIDLQFENQGKINKIYKKVGNEVLAGDILIALNTGELNAQYQSSKAGLDITQAKLAQILAGSRIEDIQVYQAAVDNAKVNVTNKEKALIDAQEDADYGLMMAYEDALDIIKTSYTVADQALLIVFAGIRQEYFNGNSQIATGVKDKENIAKNDLSLAKNSLDIAEVNSSYDNIDSALKEMKTAVTSVRNALAYIRAALDDPSIENLVSTADKTSINTERASIDTELVSLTTAEQDISSVKVTNKTDINTAQSNLDTAESALKKAEDELILKKAGPRQEDINLAQAEVNQARANLLQIQEKINKMTLISPVNGIITNIEKEEGETVQANSIIISMISNGSFQIEANISETEIAKVNLNDKSKMTLDALNLDDEFTGQIIGINPAETIVSGVIYYKITCVFDAEDSRIKSGMTVNLDIETDKKENVLYLPYYLIKESNGRKYVNVLEGEEIKEKTIKTGLEGESNIEIIEGLKEGEDVVSES
ncbi:MAG: efflux RND transporter periplasmic adaptor subunit [Patescibacteria group bacterium]|nr:efflux RND transporter periplasmic adaptor subunit [Patescibacteria group bacterium]